MLYYLFGNNLLPIILICESISSNNLWHPYSNTAEFSGTSEKESKVSI